MWNYMCSAVWIGSVDVNVAITSRENTWLILPNTGLATMLNRARAVFNPAVCSLGSPAIPCQVLGFLFPLLWRNRSVICLNVHRLPGNITWKCTTCVRGCVRAYACLQGQWVQFFLLYCLWPRVVPCHFFPNMFASVIAHKTYSLYAALCWVCECLEGFSSVKRHNDHGNSYQKNI